jgi:hypothetical protein
MNSTVVNIRKKELQKRGISDFEAWNRNPNTLYIGRNMNFYVPGTYKSKWANPYSTEEYDIEISLKKYEEYIRTSELYNQLYELDNMELGCWCKPNKCHGDILIKLRMESMHNN